MNPVQTEDHIRNLELMLYGGRAVRAGCDYGRQESGHFDGVRSRSPEVVPVEGAESDESAGGEQYVITEDGDMVVRWTSPKTGS